MRHSLKLHPHSRCEAVASLTVDVALEAPGRLLLHYHLIGSLDDLRLPPPSLAERRDRLWEHSCFEAFLRGGAGPAYYEFNFAPSTHWAAYRLQDYRTGAGPAALDPQIGIRCSHRDLELRAAFELPAEAGVELGLSAVIEEANRRKSYWALKHPPGEPDFHHKDCFAAQLPEMTDR
jgi:hypothetical protein